MLSVGCAFFPEDDPKPNVDPISGAEKPRDLPSPPPGAGGSAAQAGGGSGAADGGSAVGGGGGVGAGGASVGGGGAGGSGSGGSGAGGSGAGGSGSVGSGAGGSGAAGRGAGGSTPDAGTAGDVAPSADPEPGKMAGMTRAHNQVRMTIPVPALTWDPRLAAIAQAYADKCVYVHSMTPNLGENLAVFAERPGPPNNPPSRPVAGWADEKVDYNYATNSCAAGKQCGHYTQLVWRNTTRVGCGVRICTTGSPFPTFATWEYWVCNYAPPGNYNGQKPY